MAMADGLGHLPWAIAISHQPLAIINPGSLRQPLWPLSRHLPVHERRGNQADRVELVHEALHREAVAELTLSRREEPFDLDLADDVARAVRGLLKVEML